jgi:hypothetical protein
MTPFAQDVTRVAPTIVKQHTPYDEYMNERNKPTTRQVIDNALDETAKAGK